MSKYTIPNLPDPQQVLEDLGNPNVIKCDQQLKLTDADETLQDSYECYKYVKLLQNDLMKQEELNSKLESLNKKLVENIEKMKNQL
ncbi:unnamed protein product [Parnassius apollo]|uniref:(apollo) hypothetical protein n=1 Tax=Parnassius apollo TaxID=110799 RepID=A0A8S3XGC7_PARAO|nr:unnamed protein product [Parnassius apollo]